MIDYKEERKEQLANLKITLEHWQQNVEKAKRGILTLNDIGPKQCQLCIKYRDNSCVGCPIKEFTECSGCGLTPHTHLYDAVMTDDSLDSIRYWAYKEYAFIDALYHAYKVQNICIEAYK